MNLQELKKKYEEPRKEIGHLKKQEPQDCIYLLSIEEYKKYKNKIPAFSYWWWLRSPGRDRYSAACVANVGSICYGGGDVDDDDYAVRPILNTSNLKSFGLHYTFIDSNTLLHCGVTWKRIDTSLFIAEVPIATGRFDTLGSYYQTSEIRKFLLDWYEERKNW